MKLCMYVHKKGNIIINYVCMYVKKIIKDMQKNKYQLLLIVIVNMKAVTHIKCYHILNIDGDYPMKVASPKL